VTNPGIKAFNKAVRDIRASSQRRRPYVHVKPQNLEYWVRINHAEAKAMLRFRHLEAEAVRVEYGDIYIDTRKKVTGET